MVNYTQIKWNDLGTQALIVIQTEVNNSNMSNYGEPYLYLLSAAGNFGCSVALNKEGPIHDVAWSPNSKEFGMVYGCGLISLLIPTIHSSPFLTDMPAKMMFFGQHVHMLHNFGSAPHNTISFNLQSCLLYLAGKINVFDRHLLNKICTIDAPNMSYCSWSLDRHFPLTAMLSPHLHVDNGIKVWHVSGPLVTLPSQLALYSC